MAKFKAGDRVRLKEGVELTDTHAGGVYEIIEVTESGYMRWTDDVSTNGGNCAANFELITTKGGDDMEQPKQRRTFKQLRDMATTSKGALWQEACDDGTQEYNLITPEHELDRKHGQTRSIWDRALVEDQPKWFVEVFAVEPQYLTAEELAQWNDFKAQKLGRKRRVAKVQTPVKTKRKYVKSGKYAKKAA